MPIHFPSFRLLGVFLTLAACTLLPALGLAQPTLVWSDEFDTPGLPDPSKWSYDIGGDGWGNQELQYYTEADLDNARVENGILIIEARQESGPPSAWGSTNDYTSARLVSKSKGDWQYGRFEIRAKLPAGRGTWPAVWMLPTGNTYGGWPYSGEIDIMEHVGFDMNTIHGTIHHNDRHGTGISGSIVVPDVDTTFNVYALEWRPDEIRWFVNDVLYHTAENPQRGWESWPFIHPFHLIMNIAIGGRWGGQEGIDPDIWPQRMEVDYVRVYDLGDSPVLDADGDSLIDAVDPDDDNDGLTDIDELKNLTNPLLADTDGDGFTDKEEIEVGSWPLDPDVTPDAPLTEPILLSNADFSEGNDRWVRALVSFDANGEEVGDTRFRDEELGMDSVVDGVATFSSAGPRSGTVQTILFQRTRIWDWRAWPPRTTQIKPGGRVTLRGTASASGNALAEAIIEAGAEGSVSLALGSESSEFTLTTILRKGPISRIRVGFQIIAGSGESGSITFSNLSATYEPAVTFADWTSEDREWIDTGDWLGWLAIPNAPWSYSFTLDKWIYLPEENVREGGAWTYILK
jgi:beta-glucanase (GH16 family)